jgi:hypothetical protein
MHPTDLLGDVGHVESHFFLFGDSVSVSARYVHSFAPYVLSAHQSFWTHPMVLLSEEAQVKAHFALFGDSANMDAS